MKMALKSFDPTVYDRPAVNYEKEPDLPADQWIERFVAHLKKIGEKYAAPDFQAEMDGYARDTAPSYLETRNEYTCPEEAAETDASYWESEE
jgi:hypothetical protein